MKVRELGTLALLGAIFLGVGIEKIYQYFNKPHFEKPSKQIDTTPFYVDDTQGCVGVSLSSTEKISCEPKNAFVYMPVLTSYTDVNGTEYLGFIDTLNKCTQYRVNLKIMYEINSINKERFD